MILNDNKELYSVEREEKYCSFFGIKDNIRLKYMQSLILKKVWLPNIESKCYQTSI